LHARSLWATALEESERFNRAGFLIGCGQGATSYVSFDYSVVHFVAVSGLPESSQSKVSRDVIDACFNRCVPKSSLAKGPVRPLFREQLRRRNRGVETAMSNLFATGGARSVGVGGLPQPKGAGGHRFGFAQIGSNPSSEANAAKNRAVQG